MKGKFIWLSWGLTVVMIFMLASFASAAPKGKCTYANISPNFYMTGLDWFTARGYVSFSIKSLLADSLVVKALDGSILPALAKSWEVGDGGLSIKFNLVKNAKFHDGTPVTAQDIKYSFERFTDPELKWVFGSEWVQAFKEAVIEDDYTITIKFNKLYPAFFDRCTEFYGIAPKAYLEKVGSKGFQEKPIGSGPFKLVDFSYDYRINVTAVPDHYRKPPGIKDFSLLFVAENATRMAMLKTGEADIITLDGSQIPEIRKDPTLKIVLSEYSFLEAFEFFDYHNGTPGPWQDIRVRQAVDYAIDRKAICETLLNNSYTPYKGILAPYHGGFDPALEKPTKYDPEKAKALLREAGYHQGIRVNLYCNTLRNTVAQAISGYLQAVGINCDLIAMENVPLVKKRWARELDGVGYGTGAWWVGRTHPGVALESFMRNTAPYGYMATPEITAAVNKILAAVDERTIETAARETSEIYLKQYPQLSLWSASYTIALGPKVAFADGVTGWPNPSGFEFIKMK